MRKSLIYVLVGLPFLIYSSAFGLTDGVEIIYYNSFEKITKRGGLRRDECGHQKIQKRYSDFNKVTQKGGAWEVWKGLAGRSWIESRPVNVFKGRGSLALSLSDLSGTNLSCNNTQKIEVMTLNAGSKDKRGKYVFNFGQIRYVGFALKLGKSLDPKDPEYFESPVGSNSFCVLAQLRQDSASPRSGSPVVSMYITPHSDINKVNATFWVRWGPASDPVSALSERQPFSTVLNKAEFYRIVWGIKTNGYSRSVSSKGFLQVWVNGKSLPVQPNQGDSEPASSYKWDGWIGYGALKDPTNSSSSLDFDIYRRTQRKKMTVYFDEIRVIRSTVNRESINAMRIADPISAI